MLLQEFLAGFYKGCDKGCYRDLVLGPFYSPKPYVCRLTDYESAVPVRLKF